MKTEKEVGMEKIAQNVLESRIHIMIISWTLRPTEAAMNCKSN
jgi:hypothetical protein